MTGRTRKNGTGGCGERPPVRASVEEIVKLKSTFFVHREGEETILVPAGGSFSGLVRGNKTFGAILELLEQDVTEEQIVASLRERFDAPADVIERDVRKTVDELRRIGALDETDPG